MQGTFTIRQSGFSLVELSIVLVILGLLVGGVLAGQSLIRGAELRTLVVDVHRYNAALYAFRDKYMQLPGDMNNATSFWGSAGGNGADQTCFYVVSTTPATCNGNGNGIIEPHVVPLTLFGEPNRAWQQLANAGLIEGSYTGVGWGIIMPGTNPTSRISGGAFQLFYAEMGGSIGEVFSTAMNGNQMLFGPYRNSDFREPILRPQDMWHVDMKLDDGKPDNGRIQISTTNTGCYTGSYPNAQYALGTSSVECALRYAIR